MSGYHPQHQHPALDPRRVLNLPDAGYTADQVRYHYKALARQLHPDKRGGGMTQEQATAMFQLLTDAYRAVMAEAERRAAEPSYDALRDASRSAVAQQQQAGGGASTVTAATTALRDARGKFDISRFNSAFGEHRVEDPELDGGYTRWMEQTAPEAHLLPPDVSRQLTRVEEPAPLGIWAGGRAPTRTTELGVTRVDDYSMLDAPCTKRNVVYTDYRVAHTTHKLVDPATSSRDEFRSLEHIKTHRAALSHEMTPEDAARAAEAQAQQREREEARQEAMRQRDGQIQRVYATAHRALLGYAPSSLDV
jgi:hypothetical protein